jgi:hypothetical protein
MPVASIIIAFVIPALAALVFVIVADRPWQRGRADRSRGISAETDVPRGSWGGAWATAIAFAIGYWIIERQVFILPDSNLHWLPHAVLLAAVLGQIACLLPARVRGGWIVRGVFGALLAGTAALVLRSPGAFDAMWTALLAGSVLVFWITVDWSAWRCSGASLPLVAVPAAVGASLVVMWSGEEQLARATGNVAGATAAALLIAWWPGRTHSLATMTGMPAALTVALVGPLYMAKAYTYNDIPWLSYLGPIAAVPAGMWLGEIPWVRRHSAWFAALVRLVGACVVTAAGVYLAWRVTDTSIY